MKMYKYYQVTAYLSVGLASMLEGATIVTGESAAAAVRQGLELWASRVLKLSLQQWTELSGHDAEGAVRRLGLHAGVADQLPAHLVLPPEARKSAYRRLRHIAHKAHNVQEERPGPVDMFPLDDIDAIDGPAGSG